MSEPLTITAAAPLLRTGELTPSELLEQCLRRIDVYEPAVKAWVYLDRERARQEAAKATDEIKAGHYRGPLHGIPTGIKDIIDVFDMPTGCGSKRWANSYARQDATCVERLRQAGAIILGKTVTTAYAYLDPPVTRNPWNLDRTPGGSSSGSAAAVACGMCLASLGTQTGGSLIRPASYCGVCALKPTHGRISVNGVLPLAPSLDHIGVMANCVRDLAVVFEVVAGYDPRAFRTREKPVPACVSVVDGEVARIGSEREQDRGRLFRVRFHKPVEMFPNTLSHAVAKFMQRVERDLNTLADADAGIGSVVLPAEFAHIHRAHLTVMAVEAARVHRNRYLRHRDDYPPKIAELIEKGLATTDEEHGHAEHINRELCWRVVLPDSPQALFTPATLDAAPTPETTGNAWCNTPWSFLGLPVVSVPLGWSEDGMPLAAQFVGSEYREESLLARAAWVEQVFLMNKTSQPRRLPPVPAVTGSAAT